MLDTLIFWLLVLVAANIIVAAIWALGQGIIEEAKARPRAFAVLASAAVVLLLLAAASP